MLIPRLHPHIIGLVPAQHLEWVQNMVAMGHWEVGGIVSDRGALLLDFGCALHFLDCITIPDQLRAIHIPNLERPFSRVIAQVNMILWRQGVSGLTAVGVDRSQRILGEEWVDEFYANPKRRMGYPRYKMAHPLNFMFEDDSGVPFLNQGV